jgi:uncharacterized protein YjbI with pentapeptide repeats
MDRRGRQGGARRLSTALALALAALCLSPAGASAYIYWSRPSANGLGPTTIVRANLDGSDVDSNFMSVPDSPAGLAVDESHIYWTTYSDHYGIGRANIDGSGDDFPFLSTDAFSAAVGHGHLYWTDFVGLSMSNLDGTGESDDIVDTGSSEGIAVGSSHIYYSGSDAIGRVDLNGQDLQDALIPNVGDPRGVAVDGNHVYWANFAGTNIGRADLDGGNVQADFIDAGSKPFGVAVDASHIYWTNSCCIGRANLDGTDPDPNFIKRPLGSYWGIAVDDKIPPDTSIDSARIRSAKSKAKFRFSSTQDGSTFQCSLDGKDFSRCSSPKEYTGLRRGHHTFQVKASHQGLTDFSPAKKKFEI